MAVTKYQGKSAEILGQIRAELSASRRLVSPLMHQRLSKLYFEVLLPIDESLERLVQKGPRAQESEWLRQHDSSFQAAQKQIDDVLAELAAELKLTAPAVHSKGT